MKLLCALALLITLPAMAKERITILEGPVSDNEHMLITLKTLMDADPVQHEDHTHDVMESVFLTVGLKDKHILKIIEKSDDYDEFQRRMSRRHSTQLTLLLDWWSTVEKQF